MTNILDYISTWSAFKWIVVVLIAGFIGQFGKMLASAIVRKISLARSKKQEGSTIASPFINKESKLAAADMEESIETQSSAPEASPDKKALKIIAKASKKAFRKSK